VHCRAGFSLPRIVLASRSPRRRTLLRLLGIPFDVVPSRVDEDAGAGSGPPKEMVARLAQLKAECVARRAPDGLVLGADTVVVVDGHTLGKPIDEHEAADMLRRLAGRRHSVYTGLALIPAGVESGAGPARVETERTDVYIRQLSEEEVQGYVNTGEPFDKAGGYAIQGQGALLVKRIEGCYYNVVGLPVALLLRMLRPWGYIPWRSTPREDSIRLRDEEI